MNGDCKTTSWGKMSSVAKQPLPLSYKLKDFKIELCSFIKLFKSCLNNQQTFSFLTTRVKKLLEQTFKVLFKTLLILLLFLKIEIFHY